MQLFEAIEGGWKGLNFTMKKLFDEAVILNSDIWVIEDDCKIIGPPEKIKEAYKELPKNWDCFYLGANIQQECPYVSSNLNQLTYGWTTHSVFYSKKFVKWMSDNFDPDNDSPIDDYLRAYIQPKGHCYIIRPMICIQRPGVSDTLNGEYFDHVELILESGKYLINENPGNVLGREHDKGAKSLS